MIYTLGVDIGSAFSKAVLCADGEIKAYAVAPSGGNYRETARAIAEEPLKKAGLSFSELSYVVATGYGAAAVDFSDQTVTDISCQAKGIHRLFPNAQTAIDIGGQFSKVIKIDEDGRVTNFMLNEKCAAGSGKFLQVIARLLHIEIGDIGLRSLKSQKPVEFNTGCAVFAEAEAVSRIAEGALVEDILAGVHKAMASKIVNLVERTGHAGTCAVTGGGAKDIGLVKAIEAELGVDLFVPEEPQITAAYGAALLAAEKAPHQDMNRT
ncbi:MAG TPA: acyl-CoA dehydratase activase [Syntrophorhabdales bacterium]|nr:acyl-CoA dehydratase activase [Syntrophorhabdales bacterium]